MTVPSEGVDRVLGKVMRILVGVFGIAFAISLMAVLVIIAQGTRAAQTRTGIVAAYIATTAACVAMLAALLGFPIQVRRIVLKLRAGKSFSDPFDSPRD